VQPDAESQQTQPGWVAEAFFAGRRISESVKYRPDTRGEPTVSKKFTPNGVLVREVSGGQPGPWHEIVGVVKDATIRVRKGVYNIVL
jgi:hypothetical protein